MEGWAGEPARRAAEQAARETDGAAVGEAFRQALAQAPEGCKVEFCARFVSALADHADWAGAFERCGSSPAAPLSAPAVVGGALERLAWLEGKIGCLGEEFEQVPVYNASICSVFAAACAGARLQAEQEKAAALWARGPAGQAGAAKEMALFRIGIKEALWPQATAAWGKDGKVRLCCDDIAGSRALSPFCLRWALSRIGSAQGRGQGAEDALRECREVLAWACKLRSAGAWAGMEALSGFAEFCLELLAKGPGSGGDAGLARGWLRASAEALRAGLESWNGEKDGRLSSGLYLLESLGRTRGAFAQRLESFAEFEEALSEILAEGLQGLGQRGAAKLKSQAGDWFNRFASGAVPGKAWIFADACAQAGLVGAQSALAALWLENGPSGCMHSRQKFERRALSSAAPGCRSAGRAKPGI